MVPLQTSEAGEGMKANPFETSECIAQHEEEHARMIVWLRGQRREDLQARVGYHRRNIAQLSVELQELNQRLDPKHGEKHEQFTQSSSQDMQVFGRRPRELADSLLTAAQDPAAFQGMCEQLMKRKAEATAEKLRLISTPARTDLVAEVNHKLTSL
ncbi:hypothetical protein CYMTET_36288 [Cymbomonas tetramitiformis]|uniref:Uncharacterized protein n=1 Tax=Cymbomonas tetramitiformis TaxID=36881 RepID=A0AAE0F7M2_9CHLO|nr:hypothetical protein CYMTET_36288 [Cymbomonas tetramitiformis]